MIKIDSVCIIVFFIIISNIAYSSAEAGSKIGNISNKVKAENITAIAIGTKATSVAGGINVKSSNMGDINNYVKTKDITAIGIDVDISTKNTQGVKSFILKSEDIVIQNNDATRKKLNYPENIIYMPNGIDIKSNIDDPVKKTETVNDIVEDKKESKAFKQKNMGESNK